MSVDTSFDPRTGAVAATVAHTTIEELDAAVARSVVAADVAARTSPADRRVWLNAAADALESHLDELARIADWETALGRTRLDGEVARTANQIRFYADVAVEGSYLGAVRDEAAPHIARVQVPLGPVAVFGASNFPFAFSVFGNDTASAIAAGCSVVVKAHPAHVQVSQRVFEITRDAMAAAGAPQGILEMVYGFEPGRALVQHPAITALAFTGSQSGGMSLWRAANERATVIPVFAEMGTVNPVVVTPTAGADIATIAKGFVGSFTLGSGQFCTKPGLLLAPRGVDATRVIAAALEDAYPQPVMLTQGISQAVESGIAELQEAGATVVAQTSASGAGWSAPATVLAAPLNLLREGNRVLEECFGAVAVVVEYDSIDEALLAVDNLQGALAASVMIGDEDADAAEVLDRVQRKVGRVIVNDWPTGVAFTWAQQHGGPWPSTSNAAATSVGAAALDRFVRPVAFQGLPDQLLPPALQKANPWAIPVRVDGALIVPEST
ncbi:aldehyde dehydrogenase family protein [Aeromicrobium sp. P5_D10]